MCAPAAVSPPRPWSTGALLTKHLFFESDTKPPEQKALRGFYLSFVELYAIIKLLLRQQGTAHNGRRFGPPSERR